MTDNTRAADDTYRHKLVPHNLFSGDHWSMLAYVETVMVETGGFQIGLDHRTRMSRRNFRVLAEGCPRPKRPRTLKPSRAVILEPRNGTILSNNTFVPSHDDWDCLADLAHYGLFTQTTWEPGDILHFSPLGVKVAADLREWKQNGGSFSGFHTDLLKDGEVAV